MDQRGSFKENFKMHRISENENTPYQNLWLDTANAEPRRNLQHLRHTLEKEKSQFNNLNSDPKNLERTK